MGQKLSWQIPTIASHQPNGNYVHYQYRERSKKELISITRICRINHGRVAYPQGELLHQLLSFLIRPLLFAFSAPQVLKDTCDLHEQVDLWLKGNGRARPCLAEALSQHKRVWTGRTHAPCINVTKWQWCHPCYLLSGRPLGNVHIHPYFQRIRVKL